MKNLFDDRMNSNALKKWAKKFDEQGFSVKDIQRIVKFLKRQKIVVEIDGDWYDRGVLNIFDLKFLLRLLDVQNCSKFKVIGIAEGDSERMYSWGLIILQESPAVSPSALMEIRGDDWTKEVIVRSYVLNSMVSFHAPIEINVKEATIFE